MLGLMVKLLKVPITDCDAGRLVNLYPCSKWHCLRLVPEGRWCDRHRPKSTRTGDGNNG